MRIAGASMLVLAAVLALAASASAQPVSCGQTITEDTTLEADLNCSNDAIVIGAAGITLDLGGHAISAGATGIRNNGYDDVRIRNGRVLVDTRGIVFNGVSGSVIRDVSFEGLQHAIDLVDSDGNRIVDNSLLSVWLSLLSGSDGNVVKGNTIRAYEGFILVSESSHNRLVENLVESGQDATIRVNQGHQNRIARNTLATNYLTAVSLRASNDNEFVANAVSARSDGPAAPGLELLDGGSRNLVLRNTFHGNTVGAVIASGADNVLRRNRASAGTGDGFLVEAAATGTVLDRNAAAGFGDDGFDVDAPGTLIERNSANDNGDLGIEAVAGVIDGGGNRARGNGNPFQCVNVFCR
jgi:parallel beta-helix repeat protein